MWVAALGDIFGPSQQRGVFYTPDGGATWRHLLHVSDSAGAADLAVDPNDPRVLFAAMWQAVRQPWEMVSGGPDSDLYRSLDGGDTWKAMSQAKGFPTATKGRIGVAISPARPTRVWAIVEAAEGQSGLYRSDDRGESWELVNQEPAQTGRPWYYSHVFADPVDPDCVYTCNLSFWRSRDGGETFTQIQTPHGDNHDLWIDPKNPRRLIQGNDGGACVSFNGGDTFSSIYNQATGQIYRVDIGHNFPFDLYGTQQDNSGIRVPSRSWKGAIRWPDCLELGEAEAGDVACDPRDPRFVYLGGAGFGHPGPLLRFDQETEQAQDVAVCVDHFMGTDPKTHRHRFGWTYPISFSPHEPGTLYACGERVFRTRDNGVSWTALSPDLTLNDPSRLLASGGPITKDTSGAEVFCTIHAFSESRLQRGLFAVGTDDGLVHVSSDGGSTWNNVTPPDLPEFATVVSALTSLHDPHTLYVAAHRYRLQDRAPYVYVSRDLGRSWESMSTALDPNVVVRRLLEDPVNPRMLYLAYDSGVLASLDRGESWEPLGRSLPRVPVYDLALRDCELVAATHGRGFWILDDVTAIREWQSEPKPLTLYQPPLVYRYATPRGFDMPGEGTWVGGLPGVPLGGASFRPEDQSDGTRRNVFIDGGENPPDGVAIWYRVGPGVDATTIQLEFLDSKGTVLRTLSSESRATDVESQVMLAEPLPGLHHVFWDLRIEPAISPEPEHGARQVVTAGPRVPPGTYEVRVKAGSHVESLILTVVADPRIFSEDDALRAQYDLLVEIRNVLNEITAAVDKIRAAPHSADLEALEHLLHGAEEGSGEDYKHPPALVAKIKLLPQIVIELSDTAPTAAVLQTWHGLSAQVDDALSQITELGVDLARSR